MKITAKEVELAERYLATLERIKSLQTDKVVEPSAAAASIATVRRTSIAVDGKEDAIVAAYVGGATAAQVSEQIGIPIHAVYRVLRSRNVPRRSPGPRVAALESEERTVATVQPTNDEPEPDWTLTEDRIEPGAIAWFDTNTLNFDDKIVKPKWLDGFDGKKGNRPCVCVAADERTSIWLTMSGQFREEYQKMTPALVANGESARLGTGYLTPNFYAGPHRSFMIAAAQTELEWTRFRRPRLTDEGLAVALKFATAAGLTV